MKVFKFGGASIKNAESIINVANILKSEGYLDRILVISAMGKMTNAFELVVSSYLEKDKQLERHIGFVYDFHLKIAKDLFSPEAVIFNKMELLFTALKSFLASNTNQEYNYVYDQVVSFGELLSTAIISCYFTSIDMENSLLDARKLIKTNLNYRHAKVDWKATEQLIQQVDFTNKLHIIQGFIGGTSSNITTTLGREGSDYSAAIMAYCTAANSVTIWKDVSGVLNADPRYFKQTTLLENISYTEALEMAFYGASVIHPKTIKPLENKGIPLHVRSFVNPNKNGTTIKEGVSLFPKVPCYTRKENQILLSIAAKDFSFMIEHNISQLFQLFAKHKVNVNLIQNSAISFSVCVEDPYEQFDALSLDLAQLYDLSYHKNVTLLTIRHFTPESKREVSASNRLLLTQQTTDTVQFVMQ